jgi:phosphoglycolate phosphatase
MRHPLVLLDLDGTLVDSFADIAAGIRAACAGAGLAADDDVLALARRGVPLEDFYRPASGLEPQGEGFARFADAYRAWYLPGCLSTTAPYPGVRETLERIRTWRPRPRLAVATTKRTETARRVLEGTGLLPLLDAVVGSDGLPPKPDPAVLHAAAAAAGGGDVRLALMVGDTDRDIVAARRAGCAVAAVTYGGLPAEELARLAPDHLLAAFTELLQVLT